MKKFILALIFSLNVYAVDTHIGEWAYYNYSFNGQAGKYSVLVKSLKNEIYKVESISELNDKKEIKVDKLDKQEVFTHELAAQVVKMCSSLKGLPETLLINGKKIKTCKLPAGFAFKIGLINQKLRGDASVWAGDVPILGVVKMINGKFEMKLDKYHWNK